MSRVVRDANLETRTARARLKARDKPYYRALGEGLHLGYRKGRISGKWVLRLYRDGAYTVETLDALADDTADAEGVAVLSFAQAQEAARRRYIEHKRAEKGHTAGPYTVGDAIEAYLGYLAAERKTAYDARTRAEALILPELGKLALADLTPTRLRRWLNGLAAAPARIQSGKGTQRHRPIGGEEDRRRRRSTANRTWTVLRAALNQARRDGKVAGDDAWRSVKSFRNADAARIRLLSLDECRRLINAAQGGFRDLVQAALATGCRYGELRALVVADFNPDSGTVRIRTSKTGKGRHVVLNAEGVALFRRLTAGRAGSELVFRKDRGGAWQRSNQSTPMATACARARITPPANFHALRHAYASHAVMAGAPLLVVARTLGHTSTVMVEKHYGHLSDDFFASAVRAAAPSFGIEPDAVVTPITGRRGR
jgi:integrase